MTARSVLVLNSGSSSVKYELVDPDSGVSLAHGIVERVVDYGEALTQVFAELPDLDGLVAVGHRVVHGGDRLHRPTLLDDDTIAIIEELAPLAPLHNPPALLGITEARKALPDLPHIAVFDTAFFHDLPAAAAEYAIDRDIAEQWHIRRYGFHGTSHAYVSREAARLLGQEPEATNVIVLHLGNGASACAVRGGESVETSMGLTPLEGLVMGTRSGDIDPAVVLHLERTAGMDVADVDDLLNKRSGVLGLSGHQDMRDLVAAAQGGDADAQLALEVYCHRLRLYLGGYTAVLGRVDAVVFTAGVGENSPQVRERALADLEVLGIELDQQANEERSSAARDIATPGSPVRVLVVPTDEELEIARQAIAVVGG